MDSVPAPNTTKERRKLERPVIMCYSTIFDLHTGCFTGYLLDIHSEGMRILSEREIPIGEKFTFRLDLPELVFGKENIRVCACCMWTSPDIARDFYSSGFRINHLSEEDRGIVEGINREYRFRG
jgi:hypothetical protein